MEAVDFNSVPSDILSHILSYVQSSDGPFIIVRVCKLWKNKSRPITLKKLLHFASNHISTNIGVWLRNNYSILKLYWPFEPSKQLKDKARMLPKDSNPKKSKLSTRWKPIIDSHCFHTNKPVPNYSSLYGFAANSMFDDLCAKEVICALDNLTLGTSATSLLYVVMKGIYGFELDFSTAIKQYRDNTYQLKMQIGAVNIESARCMLKKDTMYGPASKLISLIAKTNPCAESFSEYVQYTHELNQMLDKYALFKRNPLKWETTKTTKGEMTTFHTKECLVQFLGQVYEATSEISVEAAEQNVSRQLIAKIKSIFGIK